MFYPVSHFYPDGYLVSPDNKITRNNSNINITKITFSIKKEFIFTNSVKMSWEKYLFYIFVNQDSVMKAEKIKNSTVYVQEKNRFFRFLISEGHIKQYFECYQ